MGDKKQGLLVRKTKNIKKVSASIVSFLPKIIPFISTQKGNLDNWAENARKKLKDPVNSNLELAEEFYKEGSFSDASTRAKLAIMMNKKNKQAYYILAKAQIAANKVELAEKNLKMAKKLGYEGKEFEYFSKIYLDKDYTAKPNKELNKLYFKYLSQIMDDFYIETFHYNGYDNINTNFIKYNKKKNPKILELGCGNGNLATLIKYKYPEANITGLDFSPEMIDLCKNLDEINLNASKQQDEEIIEVTKKEDQAKTIPIFNTLIRKDIANLDLDKKFDYILSRGFFNYQSDLDKALEKASKLLEKDGHMIFFLRNKLSTDEIEEIKTSYSYPFYNNYIFHELEDLEKKAKKYKLKKIDSYSFKIDLTFKATLLVYKKS
jgi:SAM-dependent methyltransferase